MKITHIPHLDILEKKAFEEPESFLQTPFWSQFKYLYGWNAHYFLIHFDDIKIIKNNFFVSVLSKQILPFGTICYLPMFHTIQNVTNEEQGKILVSLSQVLKQHLPKNTFFIRFDVSWNYQRSIKTSSVSLLDIIKNKPYPSHRKLKKAINDIQPADTVLLDLTKTEEQLLAEMKPKWRYNCRLGLKRGLEVRHYDAEQALDTGLDIFYSLYEETAQRDKISIHSKEYYNNLFKQSIKNKKASGFSNVGLHLYVAFHEHSALASIIVLFYKKEAVYLYGASSSIKRNLMPSYALQWQAIKDAKANCCEQYDFYGIPPTDDINHPMYGLYRFKTGFGGDIIHRAGSFDFPIKSTHYALFRLAEYLRYFWFKKVKKFFKRGNQ